MLKKQNLKKGLQPQNPATNKFPPSIRVAGLWANTDKNGETYLSGTLGDSVSIKIFKNTFKEKESQPDYNMFFSAKAKEENNKYTAKEYKEKGRSIVDLTDEPDSDFYADDDIPF